MIFFLNQERFKKGLKLKIPTIHADARINKHLEERLTLKMNVEKLIIPVTFDDLTLSPSLYLSLSPFLSLSLSLSLSHTKVYIYIYIYTYLYI